MGTLDRSTARPERHLSVRVVGWNIDVRLLDVTLVVALIVFAGLAGYTYDDINQQVQLKQPSGEVNVTCYTWSENGTAHANCVPKMVYAPDSWVNVTVKDCAEWTPKYSGEFQRERPCGTDFQRKEEGER